jgi:dTDP-4-amino-4,6-dideoxygalactose transaminase
VLDHGQFILGPELRELEDRLAERLGAAHVIGVASGTDALVLAMQVRGIGEGDEVITVSHSFVATASSVALAGADPVFVDVDEHTMMMDGAALAAVQTERTRAVVPVHLNGSPCALEPIADFCRRHGLALIEDCAQGLGVRSAGEGVGTRDLGCFSLHPLKVLSACGDAGFVTARSADEADALREMRNIGLQDRDHCVRIAGNSRLDTLQAAILLVKLEYLDGWIEARRRHAAAYREALAGRVTLPPEEGGGDFATYSAFVIRHPERDRLVEGLARRGVDAKVHYPLAAHQQEAFAYLGSPSLPVTEKVVGEILSLPVSPELSAEARDRVIAALDEALRELGE